MASIENVGFWRTLEHIEPAPQRDVDAPDALQRMR